MIKKRIAILGATSHIAKGIIYNFINSNEQFELHLFTRSPGKIRDFLTKEKLTEKSKYFVYTGYNSILKGNYDVLINCVGVGTSKALNGDYTKYFTVTEKYDNVALEYILNINTKALYISLSSGVVYGKEFAKPAEELTKNSISVNNILPSEYYAIARLYAEAKHRSFKSLNIVDLRIFSYFSRFIDLEEGYFISDIINCIRKKKTLITDMEDIARDYIHPKDLFNIILRCIKNKKTNAVYDIMSLKPVLKRELLESFSLKYGLKYRQVRSFNYASTTGLKKKYYSKSKKARALFYKPKFTSISSVLSEAAFLLQDKPEGGV